VRQQQGMFTFNTQMTFPYLPIISSFANHSATKGLEAVVFPFVSSLSFAGSANMIFTPLVFSSEKSGMQIPPISFNIQRQWTNADFQQPKLTIAGLLEGNLAGSYESKMIVIGDGDFAVNGTGQSARQLQPDNVNLMVNSIDYLSDDTGLIELRTKGVSSRPLDQIEDGTKTLLKYLNFILPIALIIAFGLFRMQQNRIKRFKRMQDGYF